MDRRWLMQCAVIIVSICTLYECRVNNTEPLYAASNAYINRDSNNIRTEWIKWVYPNPQTKDGSQACGRQGNISWICDPNGVLTTKQANMIEQDLDEIRRITACSCRACSPDEIILGNELYYGFTIGIALVKKMVPTLKTGDIQTEKDVAAEAKEWADYLLTDSWKLGNCGNDAVIFISTGDNTIATATGEMTSQILTVPKLDVIHKNNKMYFTDEDYYLGVQMLIKEMNATLIAGSAPTGMSSLAIYGIVFLTMSLPLLTFVAVHSMCTNHNGSFRCAKNKKHRHNPVCVAASV